MDPNDLSIRDMEAVVAVATHQHFGRAAAALGIAQPTLSSQVQRVERALEVTLFERTSRRFLITPEGRRLLPILRETLESARRLAPTRGPGKGRTKGTSLRLGIIPTLGPYLIPHLLLPLGRAGAAGSLAITEEQTASLIELVRDGALDAALLSLPVSHDALESMGLFDEPFRLIAPRESAILAIDRITPSSLRASDMLLLAEGHCLREQALAICGRRGGTTPRLVTTSLETLKYLVAAGEGYSLLPLLACGLPAGLPGLVRVRAFDDRAPARRIGLCFRRSHVGREAIIALAAFIRGHLPAGLEPVEDATFPASGVRCRRC